MQPPYDSRNLVRLVQIGLNETGNDPGPIDGLWGPQTHGAFLRYAAKTSAAKYSEPWTTQLAQVALRKLVRPTVAIDGIWGPVTAEAYLHFKESHGQVPAVPPKADERGEVAPPWYRVAMMEKGVQEIVGPRHNPRIIEYHATTSLRAKSDEVAWCASFVCWCLEECGLPHPASARARDWDDFGDTCEPTLGAIALLSRGSNPAYGHVGFLAQWGPSTIWLLGGNQSNRVNIAQFPRRRVIRFVWPK